MINNVSLTGRLVRDVDLRFTQSGKAVASFTLAVNRRFKNQDGETEADFIMCVLWGKSAEALANYTKKGSLIGVEGAVQTRSYENNEGQKVYVTEINCNNFTFLEKRDENNQQNQSFDNQNNNFNSNGITDISDDNLPF